MKKLLLVSIVIFAIAALLIVKATQTSNQNQPEPEQTDPTPVANPNDPPKLISTNPDLFEDNPIIPTNIPLEINFNRGLENEGEFKLRIEPKVEFKINLINDRKTAVITFPKPLDLGTGYTIFIGPDTKFTGVGDWREEKIFHFRTIPYKGV